MTSAGSPRTPIEAALVGRLLDRPPASARLPVGALTRAEKAVELQRMQARKAARPAATGTRPTGGRRPATAGRR